jgi:hypothetical protein
MVVLIDLLLPLNLIELPAFSDGRSLIAGFFWNMAWLGLIADGVLATSVVHFEE